MDNQIFDQRDVEIDLKELIWKILTQWKAVLLIALIMAVLVCGLKHVRDMQSYNSTIAAQKEAAEMASIPAEERIEDILSAFSDEDREKIELVLREQEWIDRQEKYIDESILMNIDPSNVKALKMTFDLDVNDSSDLPVLLQSYSLYINGDQFHKIIGAVLGKDVDAKYIGELVSTWTSVGPDTDNGQTGAVLYIQIYLPDDVDPEEIVTVSKKAISDYSKEIQGRYMHTVSLADVDDSYVYNYDFTNRFNDAYSRINNMDYAINNTMNNMTEEQKTAIKAIETIRSENIMDDIEREITETEKTKEGSVADEYTIPVPGFSKKAALLGFILGIIIYVFVYIVLLILKKRIGSVASAQSQMKSRLLGEVYCDSEPTGLAKLLHSSLVDKYHYRGKNDQNVQIVRISNTIETVCKHAALKEFTLLDLTSTFGLGNSADILNEIITSIINAAEDKGLDVNRIKAASEEEFDEKGLLGVENAILALSPNTKVSALDKLLSLCSDYGIKIFGGLYVAEK